MMKKLFLGSALAILLVPGVAMAGPYSEKLSQCIADSATAQDKAHFMKWLFSAIAASKEVKPYVNITPAQLDQIYRDAAGALMRLMSQSCSSELSLAFRNEGAEATAGAFESLGEVAADQLFSDPDVDENMDGLLEYLDFDKLIKVLLPEKR